MNSTTITVASNEELSAAIEALSSSGGTIIVKGNETLYEISKYARGPEDGTLTIVSEDPENPANFGQIKLTGSQNFTFDSIKMDSSADTDTYHSSFTVNYSDGIVFKNSTFVSYANGFYSGAEDDLVGNKLGSVRNSEGFEFINNTVDSYHQGITIIDSNDMVIADNSFTRMTADGLRLSGVQDLLIEGNSFTDFYGSKNTLNHDDMIQVWSASYNTQNTENLTIRDNYFNSGNGETTQTILCATRCSPRRVRPIKTLRSKTT